MKYGKERGGNKSLPNVNNCFKIESTGQFLGDDSSYSENWLPTVLETWKSNLISLFPPGNKEHILVLML